VRGSKIFLDKQDLNKKKLLIIVTSPLVVKLHLQSIIAVLRKQYLVVVMTNMSESPESIKGLPDGVEYLDTKMERKINLIADLKTAFLLFRFLRKESFSIVYTVSPKAGLLGIFVARIVNIPVRVHTFTGQVWQTKTGLLKSVLKILDRFIYLLATKVVVDSQSQQEFLIQHNVIDKKRSVVIGSGSLAGVDIDLFAPNSMVRDATRQKMNAGSQDIVFLFVGRLDVEKGIIELIKAYSIVARECPNTSLWLVGPAETEVYKLEELIKFLGVNSIRFLPYTATPEKFMIAADVFCLPSHREGFGTVIIESASCGIPAIGTRISGLSDSIDDEQTGFLVARGDINGLAERMSKLALDEELRHRLGSTARQRAHALFSQKVVIEGLLDFLNNEIENHETSEF